ncbi:hypothetical protein [Azospirillum humicireducens]|uniref:hypothetical protein n=1 Tax=Azospirillum humicireducens TaxID=1226968 RepID=UPI0011B23F3B|nr:hypothetical protein [Azospirillum humicireducens]
MSGVVGGYAVGRLGRDVMRRKLERLLAQSVDEGMIALVSAIAQLQAGNPAPLQFLRDFPSEAVGASLQSDYHIPLWILETIVNELLATPKKPGFGVGMSRILRADRFASMRLLANVLIELENAEDGIFLAKHDVFTEMARIAQRQFPWQRGIANGPSVYRSLYLYGSGRAASFFESSAGITVSDFVKVGFYLSSRLGHASSTGRFQDLSSIAITPDQREAALAKYALPHAAARSHAMMIRADRRHTAYRPSILRDFPVITFGDRNERLRAPISELITYRFTSGLHRDVVTGGAAVWTEIGSRFEQYCLDYLQAMMRPFTVIGEQNYGTKKSRYRTPDVLVMNNGVVHLVAECKAKRMSFDARFSDDPAAAASLGFNEIAKGIFQIWRFFAHARTKVTDIVEVHSDCQGILITADSWLTMARNQEAHVYRAAHAMADQEGGIEPQDRRDIAFCVIDDIEFVLQNGSAEAFLTACRGVCSGEKKGWILSVAHAVSQGAARPYPFLDRIGEILPWWNCEKQDYENPSIPI